MPIDATHLLTKYTALAGVGEPTVTLFLEESYRQLSPVPLRPEAYDYAVELHAMMCMANQIPQVAQAYNISKERIRSEEGDSKEEAEYTYGTNAVKAGSEIFKELYDRHIRSNIITTRIYPGRRW